MTLPFNPLRAMVITYLHAKVQRQRSVDSEDRVETNERTDGYIISHANAVGNELSHVPRPTCRQHMLKT